MRNFTAEAGGESRQKAEGQEAVKRFLLLYAYCLATVTSQVIECPTVMWFDSEKQHCFYQHERENKGGIGPRQRFGIMLSAEHNDESLSLPYST